MISANFAASQEYRDTYAGMDNRAIVNAVYQNLFGRPGEAGGLDYWAGLLDRKAIAIDNVVTQIAGGAQGADLATYENRTDVAVAFTNALDTPQEAAGYSGDAALGRAKLYLSSITDDASRDAALKQTAMPKSVLYVIGAAPAPLTVKDDLVLGTDGDDVFAAITDAATGILTLNGKDDIDGGAGDDVITVDSTAGGVAIDSAVTVMAVERLAIVNADGTVNADLSSWQGLQEVTVAQHAAGAVELTTNGNVATVSVAGGEVTLTDAASIDSLATVSLDGHSGVATIVSDALTSLSLANATGGATVEAAAGERALDVTFNNASGTVTDRSATSISATVTGAAASITLATDAATAINLAGDQAITLALDDAGINTDIIKTITSTNSAGVTITTQLDNGAAFSGGAGADAITVGASSQAHDMGAGDDVVTITATLAEGASIVGGEGRDTLVTTVATAAAISAAPGVVSGFETLGLGAASGTSTSSSTSPSLVAPAT